MTKIAMIVFNTFENDSRVLKEAISLHKSHFEIDIYCLYEKGLQLYENKNEYNVIRLKRSFLHYFFNRSNINDKIHSNFSVGNYKNTNKSLKSIFLDYLLYLYRYINEFLLVIKFYNNLKSKDYEIIHCNDYNTLKIGYKLKNLRNIKLVYDSHELWMERNKYGNTIEWIKKIMINRENKYLKKVDLAITVNNSISEYLFKLYNKKFVVIQNATPLISIIDKSKNIRSELNISDDKKIITYIGGIFQGRGIENVIKVLKNFENLVFILIGPGEKFYIDKLKELSVQNNCNKQLIFYGLVPSNDVPNYASSCDFGIASIEDTCLSYYYSLPNKVFEYIQAELPIICSDFPELINVVEKNRIGYSFNINDQKSLISAINKLINDSDINDYKERLKELKKEYCWENEERKLVDEYLKLINI